VQKQESKSAPEMMEYSVKGSDTLASIALKFNTTTSKLTRMNRLSSRLLFPGQTLFVPVKINLLEKESLKQNDKNELELVTRPPTARPQPSRQSSLSPDHQIEELLKKGSSGNDEISEKYLRINGRYITDGQGVVPGVLLVTPQTIMFNPSVVDHLVIERGHNAYTVRTPMKAVKEMVYYHDIAALVLGDTSGEFDPGIVYKEEKTWPAEESSTVDTSNYVSQDTADVLSETRISSLKDEDSGQPLVRDDISAPKNGQEYASSGSSSRNNGFQRAVDEISQDETVTESCNCSRVDESKEYTDSSLNKTVDEQSDTTAELRGTFTNHDRDVVEGNDVTKRTIENAEYTRDSIDINDTKCTSTPRKVKENTKSTLKVNGKDDGLIYTKIQPRSTINSLTGNAIKLEGMKKESDGDSSVATDSMSSFSDDTCFHHMDASRDSGISESASLLSTTSRSGTSFARENSENKRPTHLRSSSLSAEARQWLGERGIRLNVGSEDEGNCSESFDASKQILKPKPAALTADDLNYICLRVHESYWCRSATLQTHIMGIPQNRDQQRMEHWFAVPQVRIAQLHTFFTTWKRFKNERSTDGLSIVDDTFSKPSMEELFLNKFEQARQFQEPYKEGYVRTSPATSSRQSGASSINEDDTPELTDTSSILEKMQLVALSRELPSRTVGHRWNLVYSTAVHGISLKTLYRNTQNIETPVLLVIIDQEGQVFGAFLSDSPKVCEGYYGTGESMLFKFLDQKTVKAYRWTGTNSFFIKGDSLCLSVGGGDGTFGLWLDGDLNHGRSHSCKTFDNDTLSSKEDFICRGLEAWSFE